eukprot:PDM83448.1 rps-8 [Pristionchus pacificus]
MDDSEVNRLILENLHPKDNIPQPLDEDFYKEIVNSTPSSSSDEFFPPTRPNRDNATEASVKKILNESQGLIDKAALKLVAPNAVNVAGAQFHDLVRLSVDEAAIVQAEEEAINASRKKANASGKETWEFPATRGISAVRPEVTLGRPAANTKIGAKRVHIVRARGGNLKYRALRLDTGNFSWGSEGTTRKTRIIDTVYNASNNELVRTKTLVKNTIVSIDAVPFRQWYESHYAQPIGRKKGTKFTEEEDAKFAKAGKKVYKTRQTTAAVDPHVTEQFMAGKLLACVSSRPGQVGRCDGYILEGKELEFYLRKIRAKKQK